MGDRVKDRVVLISGGASGMGAAQALLFAQEGAKVVLGDIQDELGKSVAADIVRKGYDAVFTHLDVTNLESWQDAVRLTVARFGKLTTLLNTAGIYYPGGVETETVETWDRMIAVNQQGVFFGMKAAAPELLKTGNSAIVNISSVYGLIGSHQSLSYHASKAAVRMMGKAVALELARKGVRVNTIFPGQIQTPLMGMLTPEQDAINKELTPMGRVGDPIDIAYGSLFLASDEAKYITGAELSIDGGWAAGA